jgi:hypothetical protein
MTVPEAAVDENDSSVSRQYDIRVSWQIFSVQPKSSAKPVKN